jgi:hypothetical protein
MSIGGFSPKGRSVSLFAALSAGLLLVTSTAGADIRFDAPLLTCLLGDYSSNWPSSFAIGDLDGDDRLDVVAGSPNYPGIRVSFGRGDGTLEPPAVVPSGLTIGVAVGDVDHDGFLDFASAGPGGEAAVYFGSGGRGPWSRVTLPMEYGVGCGLGDFDGDGRLDVVVPTYLTSSNWAPAFRVFMSRPGRTFQAVTNLLPFTFNAPWNIRFADFNHDGRLDLVFSTCSDGPPVVGLGGGDGTLIFSRLAAPQFAQEKGPPAGIEFDNACGWGEVDVADFDVDGFPDVVVAGARGVYAYRGKGDGTFEPSRTLISEISRDLLGLKVADFDHDGTVDLVFTHGYVGSVDFAPGLGGWSFGAARSSQVDPPFCPIESVDMNGDEILDLVGTDSMSPYHPGVLVALGDGSGEFGHPLTMVAETSHSSTVSTLGDFDGDGSADIVVVAISAESRISIHRAVGPRSYDSGNEVSIPGYAEVVRAADVDHDGWQDVVAQAEDQPIVWVKGLGDGRLGSMAVIPQSEGLRLFDARDVTGDGWADLLCSWSRGFQVLPSAGGGAFGPPEYVDVGSDADAIALGDLNGDAIVDVAAMGDSGVFVAYGTAAGTLAPTFAYHSPFYRLQSVAIGDVNADGRDDLIVVDYAYCPTCASMSLKLVRRTQRVDGTLDPAVIIPWPQDGVRVAPVGDLNGDSRPDLVYWAEWGLGVALADGVTGYTFEGGYGGVFMPGGESIRLADLDQDGRLDALVNDSGRRSALGVGILYGRDPTPPVVTVTGPASATGLPIGSTVAIEWTASDNVGIRLVEAFVSRHGFHGPFDRIGSLPGTACEIPWTITGPPSDSVVFKVVVRDSSGNVAWDRTRSLGSILPALARTPGPVAPPRLVLRVEGPNPVRDQVALTMEIPAARRIRLAVLDLQGRTVVTLLDELRPAGVSTSRFSIARTGVRLRAGLYFMRLDAGGERATTRIAYVP